VATKRVLSVGQCAADHWSIKLALRTAFDAEVVPADSAEEAAALLRQGGFDLVLANRLFDSGGGNGLDFIRRLKADPQLAGVPVMLVSNYEHAQAQAVAAGAVPGFGKAELGEPAMLDRLRPHLGRE
jgi:CheY-like chemotaxis protein